MQRNALQHLKLEDGRLGEIEIALRRRQWRGKSREHCLRPDVCLLEEGLGPHAAPTSVVWRVPEAFELGFDIGARFFCHRE